MILILLLIILLILLILLVVILVIWHVVNIMVPFGSLICHGLSILGTQDGTILELAMTTEKTIFASMFLALSGDVYAHSLTMPLEQQASGNNPVNPPSLQILCHPKKQHQEVKNSGTKVREVDSKTPTF